MSRNIISMIKARTSKHGGNEKHRTNFYSIHVKGGDTRNKPRSKWEHNIKMDLNKVG